MLELTLGVDFTAEEGRDLTGDGQAKAGSAVSTAGGAVALLKGSEHFVQVLFGYTDAGVDHGEHHGPTPLAAEHAAIGHLDPKFHPALFGELHRIGQQVAQYLLQTLLVGEKYIRQVRSDIDRELQTLLRGQGTESGLDILDQLRQGEALQVDIDLPSLNLGKIQDIVDELKKVGAGRVDDVGVLDLLRCEVASWVLSQQPPQNQQAVQRRT